MNLYPKRNFVEGKVLSQSIIHIALHDNQMEAPWLTLQNFVNLRQTVKHKQDQVVSLVSNLKPPISPPQLLESPCNCLHLKKMGSYEFCCNDKFTFLMVFRKDELDLLFLRQRHIIPTLCQLLHHQSVTIAYTNAKESIQVAVSPNPTRKTTSFKSRLDTPKEHYNTQTLLRRRD